MTDESVIDSRPVPGRTTVGDVDPLCDLDQEILGLVAEGETGAMVAYRLGLSLAAVAERLVSIRAELGVDSTAEAVRVARCSGLV